MTDLTPKKGIKTSELWVTLVPTIIVVAKLLGVDIGADDINNVLIAASAIAASAYTISRTFLKVTRIKNATVLKDVGVVQKELQYIGSYAGTGTTGTIRTAQAGNDVAGQDPKAAE